MDLMRFDGIVRNLSVAVETVGLDGIRSVHGLLYPTVPMHVVRSVAVHAFQPCFPVRAVTIESVLVALETSLLRYLIVSRIDVAIPAAGSIARRVDGCPIGVGLGMTLLARQIPKRGLGEPAGAIFVDVLSPVARPSGVQAGRKSI
jgi:hypothetical protein